jgi:chromosome partition protein MukF
LDDEQLRGVIYPAVSAASHGDPTTISQRATRAIARLHDQQLVIRTDTFGILADAQFTLSDLGKAIAEWILTQEALNSQDLQVMMTHVRAGLGVVKAESCRGGDQEHWETQVVKPLKLAISSIIEMIDRRKRGLDVEHADIRERISKMLDKDWFQAIEACDALLDRTSQTLRELHRVLNDEVEETSHYLNEIEESAFATDQSECLRAVGDVRRHLEQLNSWAKERLHSWSEFYHRVHEYIRSVVQFDPDRAIRYRLRESIREYGELRWGLAYTEQLPYLALRNIEDREEVASVRRPAEDRTRSVEKVLLSPSLYDKIRGRLTSKLETGEPVNFRIFLRGLLEEFGVDDVYGVGGRVVEQMIRSGMLVGDRSWEWTEVGEQLYVQDFTVRAGKALSDAIPGLQNVAEHSSGGNSK